MKKGFVFLAVIAALIVLYVYNHAVIFSYVNPYTNTSGFKYISKTIYNLGDALKYARSASKKEKAGFNYLFWNAYGSGFLRNNPVPNDLDFAVGIDLGEYDYDGDNADIIAQKAVEKMQSFQNSFNFYINTNDKGHIWSTSSPLEYLTISKFNKYAYRQCIQEQLDSALSGKQYIRYAKKQLEDDQIKIIEIPYLMQPNEILIEEYRPMLLFSDTIAYNPDMPNYLRELTVMPEFFITVKQNGKKTRVELVPESYLGARLQLARRAFASNVFAGSFSIKFQKDLKYMNNDEEYLFYRLFTFRRHLQEAENIVEMHNKPVKLYKRILQTADAISPALDEGKYKEISDWALENLSDPKLQLLNEYETICRNFLSISLSKELFEELSAEGCIRVMYDNMGEVLDKIEENNYIDKASLKILKDYHDNELKAFLNYKQIPDFPVYRIVVLKAKYDSIAGMLADINYKNMKHPEKLKEYIDMFNSIYTKAGFHSVEFCWLDKETVGVIKDDFTAKIPDLNKFAKENGLTDLNYKLITQKDVPIAQLRYDIWVRHNPSKEEIANWENTRKLLLEDKKNFNIKKKVEFVF